MLHTESRQGGEKNLHPLVLLLLCLFTIGCTEATHKAEKVELSDLSEWVDTHYALNAQQLAGHLEHFISTQHDSLVADRAVKKYYKENPSLQWVSSKGLRADADSLLAVLQREVPQMGFDEKAFFLPQLQEAVERFHTLDFDEQHTAGSEVAQLDVLLTKAYVRYAIGQHYGFTRPESVFNAVDPKTVDTLGKVKTYCRLFDIKVEHPDYQEPFRKLQADSVCPYLAEVLPTDGVYQKLQQTMATATADERRRLAINMERRRWRTQRVENSRKHIFVNVAAQHLWAVDGDSVLPMRICYGALKTKSPLLSSAITYMEINPNWGIPLSIIRNDVARHGGDSAYFARHRYTIYGPDGAVDPRHVTSSMLTSGRYRVSQKGGAGNSLGRIVFRFPNNFAVYLHDTSNRGAFQYANRALSHGCIRVQKPFELAHYLLPEADEWTLDKIRISMDIKPETEQGRKYLKEHVDDERPLRLINTKSVDPHIPVVIDYYTAYPNPKTGAVETWPDGYGYDRLLARSLKPFLR